jgi:NADPH:quinone reductase-like Zn-dependent oxidoreductase
MRLTVTRVVLGGAAVLLCAAGAAIAVAYYTSGNSCNRHDAPLNRPMKAIFRCDYGRPSQVQVGDVETPALDPDQVLVKVRAASANPLEWHLLEGKPYLLRAFEGLRQPDNIRLGVDFAGTIQAVGGRVTHFKVGDEVFGGRDGSFAEYVAVRESRAIALKPTNVSFDAAATVAVAGVTALEALREHGHLHAGQQVLINGASGGVGTFAVQIAKALGATVTGVTSGKNVDLVSALGADRVIDYTKEDYSLNTMRYDVILDCIGNKSLSDNRRILADHGSFVSIGGGSPDDAWGFGWLHLSIAELLVSPFVHQTLTTFEAAINQPALEFLAALMQQGKLRPVIDRSFPLQRTADALRYLETGHAHGKVLVTMP